MLLGHPMDTNCKNKWIRFVEARFLWRFIWLIRKKAKDVSAEMPRGLWDNIHAKRKRIKAGSGEKMRKPGTKGAPTAKALKNSQSKKRKKT
jgi:hypothetical protein